MASSLSNSTSVVGFPVARIDPLSADTGIVKLEALWAGFQRSLIEEKRRDASVNLFFALFWSWIAYKTYKYRFEHSELFIVQAAISWWLGTLPTLRGTWLGITARFVLIATSLTLLFRALDFNVVAQESWIQVLVIIALCIFIFYNGRAAYKEVCWRFPKLWQVTVDQISFLLLPDGRSFLWFIGKGARAAVTLPISATAAVYRAISERDLRFLRGFCAKCGSALPESLNSVSPCCTCPGAQILFVWPRFPAESRQ